VRKVVSTDDSKKRAEPYRKAARDVELRDQYTCWAIKRFGGDAGAYSRLFKTESGCTNICAICLRNELQYEVSLQDWRVLALCFMAALVEAGDA
jgi:hypothetical protein